MSGPLAKGRAWFHNGFDGFYNVDYVSGLPRGQNRTQGLTTSDLSRFQVNLTPANILTGSFLFNLADIIARAELPEPGGDHHQPPADALHEHAARPGLFHGGALLDVGFADSRSAARRAARQQLFQITPFGNRGNYFVDLDRHFYRQQWVANLFLPTCIWAARIN